MNNVIDFINTHRDRYVEELKTYLAIPSISALPQHAEDVRKCAEWTRAEMERIGLQNVRLIETPGHPVVYGDWLGAEGCADDPVLRALRRAARGPARSVGIPAIRGDGSRRRDLRARLGRRQGPDLHALQGHRGALEAERQVAGEHEDHPRGRGGSRVLAPRRLRPRPQIRARRRRRRHFRLADVRPRHPVDLLRASRARLLPDRSSRDEERPAFRIVRRRRGESRARDLRRCWRR